MTQYRDQKEGRPRRLPRGRTAWEGAVAYGREVDTLRIGTFNLLHGMGMVLPESMPDGADDRNRFVEPPPPDPALLRAAAAELDADVLGLQEVDRHQERSGGKDQTAEVADALGATHRRFVPAVHGTPGVEKDWTVATHDDGELTDGPTYGVGLVSRLPVLDWRVKRFDAAPFSIPLLVPGVPRPRLVRIPDEPRVALAAVIDGPSGPFSVVTAHLSFVPGYNLRQVRTLARWASNLPRPCFLIGDFNLPGALPRIATGWDQLAKVATYPSMRPKVQFDHVLARGLPAGSVHDVSAHSLAVSDHCALTVDVALPS
jgi:endonuclease/exonuclease/phosphatase family metal-dependent hydrolase